MKKVLMGGVGALVVTLSLASCVNIDNAKSKLEKEGFKVTVSNEGSTECKVEEKAINMILELMDKDKRVEVKSILAATKITDSVMITQFGSAGDCNAVNELFEDNKLTDVFKGYVKTDGKYLVAVSSENLFDLVF